MWGKDIFAQLLPKKNNLKIPATFKRKFFVNSLCILRASLYVIFRKCYFKIYFKKYDSCDINYYKDSSVIICM